jgi:hypothetical protein
MAELKKVKASMMNAVHDLPLLVARDEGFFRDEGLDVDILVTPGSGQHNSDDRALKDDIFKRGLEATYDQGQCDQFRMCEWGIMKRAVESNLESNHRPAKIVALGSAMSTFAIVTDPKTGNDYMLTVQYPEAQVKSLTDLKSIPLRSPMEKNPTQLDMISKITRIQSPTEVDHYQLRRIIDVFVRPSGEDLGKMANAIDQIIQDTHIPPGVAVDLRGMVQGMRASFKSFGIGLILSIVLLYLILVAQFRSFVDPFLILLAVLASWALAVFAFKLDYTPSFSPIAAASKLTR